jgi:hypothetical protein
LLALKAKFPRWLLEVFSPKLLNAYLWVPIRATVYAHFSLAYLHFMKSAEYGKKGWIA